MTATAPHPATTPDGLAVDARETVESVDTRRANITATPMTQGAAQGAADGIAKTPTASPLMVATPTPMASPLERLAMTPVPTAQPGAPVPLDRIPQAVVAVTMTAERTTLRIDPPELGRIQLDYQFDTQGRTVVTLVPETDAARAALVERIASITTALQQSLSGGVDVNIGAAREFAGEDGPAFGQDRSGGESNSGQSDANDTADVPTLPTSPLDRAYTLSPGSGSQRLHILV